MESDLEEPGKRPARPPDDPDEKEESRPDVLREADRAIEESRSLRKMLEAFLAMFRSKKNHDAGDEQREDGKKSRADERGSGPRS
ncbi:hypothetical protein HY251_19155 [bacterium]|nr:hypothetical protein [bacterium]